MVPSRCHLFSAVVLICIGYAAPSTQGPAGDGVDAEAVKFAQESLAAATAGDAAKARELALKALDAAPESLAARAILVKAAELRREPQLMREHLAELVNFQVRAARLKEKLRDENLKITKDAESKLKTVPDVYAQGFSKAVRTWADSILKNVRIGKSQKNWKFAADHSRIVKDLFENMPGLLDPKDPRAAEATKLYNEAVPKKGEDRPETDKMKADVSDAVSALSTELQKLADQASAHYEEVRGPLMRRRALAAAGVMISVRNDPEKWTKQASELWARAAKIEASGVFKLRLANDASRFCLVVNGTVITELKNATKGLLRPPQSEHEVRLFRECNVAGFYGHEISDPGRKGGRPEAGSRVWFLMDIPVTEKESVGTSATWVSLTRPPTGWDQLPNIVLMDFPVSVVADTRVWDYEKTKTWKGLTLAGDATDCWLRGIFDLPAGVVFSDAVATPAEASGEK